MRNAIVFGTILCLVLLLPVEGDASTTISFISPRSGSANGGTQIRISGSDFDVDLDLSSSDAPTELYFVSAYHSYPCDLHKEESDENSMACYTRKMDVGTYQLRVIVRGVDLSETSYCNGFSSSYNCRFYVEDWRTPLVNTLSWHTGEPQQLITVSGRLHTNLISSSEAEATNGVTARITRVYTEGEKCALFNATSQLPYGIHLYGDEGNSRWGEFNCFVEGTYIGYRNISFIVDGQYGRSRPQAQAQKLSVTNDLYMFQTYAVVTDVSPKEGSTLGGTTLTISGRHFYNVSQGQAEVMVGGTPCEVHSVTDTEIQCTTAAESSAAETTYSGGRGMVVEVFPGESDIAASLDSSSAGTWRFFVDHTHPNGHFGGNDNFVARSRGYFVPSVTANHLFYMKADDEIKFSFNKNGRDPAGADSVTMSTAVGEQVNSPTYALQAGMEYYFEVRCREGTLNEYFQIGVYIDETVYTAEQTSISVEEKQTISITSTVTREVQEISFENWAEQTEVESQYTVLLDCNAQTGDCSGQPFTFSLFGTETDQLYYNEATASTVADAINSLVGLAGDSVEVTDTGPPGSFEITFKSTRGRMVLTASTVQGSDLTVTMTESVQGKPKLDTFTFKVNNFVSPPLHVDPTELEVSDAVKSLFGPTCPSGLGNVAPGIAYYDFEVDTPAVPSGARSAEKSFCGIYSLKNPSTLYADTTDNPYLSLIHPYICFGYNGDIGSSITVSYSFKQTDAAGEVSTVSVESGNFGQLIDSNDWTHVCHNLHASLRAAHPDGDNFRISRVRISAGSDEDTDLFVDNIYIGPRSDSEMERQALLHRVVPSAVPHIKLEDVQVVKSGSTFTITFIPIDCGHNFPLLGFAFSEGSTNVGLVANEHVQHNFGDSNAQIVVRRTNNASPPVTGTFDISFADNSYLDLTDISASIEAEELENELKILEQIDNVAVTREGTCSGYSWMITFKHPAGNHPAISVDGALSASPDTATVAATTIANGGLYMNPIYGDFLRTAHDTPQVQVYIDGILSHCEGSSDSDSSTSCDFSWQASATPTVTSIAPTSGSTGDTITLFGTGFSEANEDNMVIIGGVECSITSSLATFIECTLGNSPSGLHEVMVVVSGKGKADVGVSGFQVTGRVTSISPSTGSDSGCTTVTISGSGFESQSTVLINGNPCVVESSTYSSIQCVTSGGSIGSHAVEVTTGGVTITSSDQYSYATPSASISSVSSATVSSGEALTICGTGFGTTSGSIFVGSVQSTVTSWTDSEILIVAPALPSGVYEVMVKVSNNLGCANSRISVEYSFTVTGISPQEGSLSGGTEVTLTGSGFHANMSIRFGDVDCVIKSVSSDGTSSVCTTVSAGTNHVIRNTGRHPTLGLGYEWEPSTLNMKVGDAVTFEWSPPILVEGLDITLQTSSDASSTEYDGVGFQVAPAPSGYHTFTLNNGGTIYYNSGCLTTDCSVVMRGTINVAATSTTSGDLSVSKSGVEASYPSGTLSFSFSTAQTAIVTSITPRQGTVSTDITITGSGFGSSPQVTVGGAECTVHVQSSNDASITCRVSPSGELAVGTYQEVVVKTSGGTARSEIRRILDRRFVLLPEVERIFPASGSLQGGTRVEVTGSGFSAVSAVSVGGWYGCAVVPETVTYNSFDCVTSGVPSDKNGDFKVSVGSLEATCSSSCEFSYTSSSTPQVTDFFTDQSWSNLGMTFTGTGFGSAEDNVKVEITSQALDASTQCTVVRVTDTEVLCLAPRFASGPNKVSLLVAGKGLAKFDSTISPDIDNPATIDYVSPTSGSLNGGTQLTIVGNGFLDQSTTVQLGGNPCDIVAVTLSTVTCMTRASTAGMVDVAVESHGQSYDITQYEYSSASTPEVTDVSPSEGSYGGTITLSGSLFGLLASDVTVKIGGAGCVVDSVSDTEIQCTLGEREGGAAEIEVRIEEKGIATITALPFQYELAVNSLTPTSGSYGGSQVITINGNGFSANTVVNICGNLCHIISQTSSQIMCLTPAHTGLSSGSTVCDVGVANGDNMVTKSDVYAYESSLTPIITSVSPNRGGTGGGTTITITGTGLFSPLVTIDGSVCDIQSSTETEIICITNSHQGSIRTKVSVTSGEVGIAIQDNADFYYIDRWSSVFTWGGTSLPQAGEFVIIQKGQTVLLDTDTEIMKMLLIDGGELIFDEADVKLKAENILITNGGLLQVGTEDAPFQHYAVIEMHGHLRSPELPIYGAKTLGVRNGTLDLHGRPVLHTWTLLAATANAGATQITLQQSVSDWNMGDEIVIASTGLRRSQSENEQRTIADISADGFTLTLNEALEYTHLGVTQSIAGRNIEYRAEVGLLTRNIVFRGSDHTAWHDDIPKCEAGFETGQFATQTCFQGRHGAEVGSDQFGGSIMMHSKYPNSPDVMARIEHVEVTHAGQAFRLGRYPIHWHLMGNVSGMYVRKCAIHKTFNRAVTIHGTHNLLVEGNVVYDIMGGAIFIEDGIETKNVIQYNLAVFVRQSTSLLNDDITPAAYWVTNPDNVLRHNHAAGGTHFGFWYRMHEHPDGPSFTPDVCQQKVELGEFSNNTVHSQGWFGIWIFQTYFPMKGGSCDSNEPSPAKFRSLTTWNCEKGAEWVNCGAIQFIDFVMVDNEVAGMDIKLIKGTEWGEEKGALIKDSLIVGHSDAAPAGYESNRGIVLPFAPGLTVSTTTFANFNRGGTTLSITSIQGTCILECGGFYNHFDGIQYIDVTRKVSFRWLHEAALYDADGTLTGREAGSTIVPFSGVMDPAHCEVQSGDEYSAGGTSAAICDPTVSFHRMAVNQPIPTSLEGNDLYVENDIGNTSSTYQKKRLTLKVGWMMMLPSKKTYKMFWDNGEQFTNLSYNSRFYDFKAGDYIYITHTLPQDPDYVAINNGEPMAVAEQPVLSSSSHNLDWYYDTYSNKLTIQLSNDASSSRRKRAIEIVDDEYQHVSLSPSIYRCFYEDCLGPVDQDDIPPSEDKPSDSTLWSDADNPCIEGMGTDTIVIKKSADDIPLCWVVVDVSSITVKNLTVFGVLHFEDHDVTLEATYILVLGRLYTRSTDIGYYDKQLTINLVGDHSTPAWSLPGIELGSKAIGCFGGCDLHGIPHDVYWTQLAQTAAAGSKTIVLKDAVDWKVGDEIVITTTSYNAAETEKHVIASIDSQHTTITLVSALAYLHLAESQTVGSDEYHIRAEVGLLTRNIKVQGVSYDEMESQAFGARVLVGYTTSQGNQEEIGWGRFSDVEFFQTGQEGWTEPWDPRFSLAFVNTGTPSDARPSFVHGCSFHDGFSTAIGIFGASGIAFTQNVVHRTIHDGIRISGDGHSLISNLVTVTLFRGTWHDRFELTNFKDWQASFEISEATNLIMRGNTAAGSERVGFHTDGEACDAAASSAWTDNTAHGCLHGIQMMPGDGVGDCSLLRNFFIYKSWDFGIYHQTSGSIVVRDSAVIDSKVAYLPLVFGPEALTHTYADKSASLQNFTCVGRSYHFDSAIDTMDENTDKNLLVRAAGPDRTAPFNNFGGKTCVMLPLFQGAPNAAPFKPFHGNLNYPAIRGLLNITGFRAHSYKKHSDDTRDLVFYINPKNEDIFHPTIVSKAVLTNVEEASKVHFERPSLGLINPSDCVDMECDGRKKVMIKDLDGSFLGGVGAIIPQAEFGWDDSNHINRGLGDYRIPKGLLTNVDGSRIQVSEIVDHRGIIRNSACLYNDEWQAYDCHGTDALDYQMLVIESMDEDTETRRLSPVAVLSDTRYIDLNNGPQDHGWCFGYTCQKRISTFYVLVASAHHYDIYFTGYAPRELRLQLLNVDDSVSVRVALWYARPERLDVYRDESKAYIHPQNAIYDASQGHWVLDPATSENKEGYIPAINSPVHGANFMDLETRLLYITLKGPEPVKISTVPAVIVSFGFPAVEVDDFFGENLVQNLANFLNVPPEKIRVVKIERETTSSRKRRDTSSSDTVTFQIMYSDEITNTSSPVDRNTAVEILNNGVRALIVAYQNNTLSDILGVNATTVSAATIHVNLDEEVRDDYLITYNIPHTLSVTSLPTSTEEYVEFSQQPVVTLLDKDENRVATLDDIFEVSVTLDLSGQNAHPNARLLGNTSVMFTNGTAQFTDLMITHLGTYTLRFAVTQPAGITLESDHPSLVITQRTVQPMISGVSNFLAHNSPIDAVVELQNSAGAVLPDVGYKNHIWRVNVSLDSDVYGSTTVGGTTIFTIDPATARVTTAGLMLLNTESNLRYNLKFTIYTDPELYTYEVVADPIEFFAPGEVSSLPVQKNLAFVLSSSVNRLARNDASNPTFNTYLHNQIARTAGIQASQISAFSTSTTNNGNTMVTVTLNAADESAATMAITALRMLFENGLSYNGNTYTLASGSNTCGVTVNGVCQDETTNVVAVNPSGSSGSDTQTWVYIVVGVVLAIVLAAGAIIMSCFLKRSNNKIGAGHGVARCLDAESSRGSTPFADSFYTGSTDLATPTADSQIGNYPELRHRSGMTPVET